MPWERTGGEGVTILANNRGRPETALLTNESRNQPERQEGYMLAGTRGGKEKIISSGSRKEGNGKRRVTTVLDVIVCTLSRFQLLITMSMTRNSRSRSFVSKITR